MPQSKQKLHCFWVLLFVVQVACSQKRTLCSRTLLECDYITAVINHKCPADLQHWIRLVESTTTKPSLPLGNINYYSCEQLDYVNDGPTEETSRINLHDEH